MQHSTDWTGIMPERIAQLQRDHRGYPIPHIVLIDADGRPNFVINDINKVIDAVRDNLCHICGQKLDANPWFVGGPGAALLNGDRAVYIDGPLHVECMTFALKVCPYLAMRMARPVELEGARQKLAEQGIKTVTNTALPGTPDVFVAVQAPSFEFVRVSATAYRFVVRRPVRKTQYWKDAQMLSRSEGEELANRAARTLAKNLGRKS